MHIILRYEMERALIKGELKVEDVSGRLDVLVRNT